MRSNSFQAINIIASHPWIFPACRLGYMPAVPIRVLEGWRCNSIVESASLKALLSSNMPKSVLCKSHRNVPIVRASCTGPAARHQTIGLDLRRRNGEGVVHRLSLTLFSSWKCMSCCAVCCLKMICCAGRRFSRSVRLYCELNVASVLRVDNPMSIVELVQTQAVRSSQHTCPKRSSK